MDYWVFKTNNVYAVDIARYKKLLTDNVTTHYKIDSSDAEHKINTEAKNITTKLKISDRVQKIQ